MLPNVPSSNEYKGGFGTALMTKDLGLAQDAATRAQSATPLGSLAHQVRSRIFENVLLQKILGRSIGMKHACNSQ